MENEKLNLDTLWIFDFDFTLYANFFEVTWVNRYQREFPVNKYMHISPVGPIDMIKRPDKMTADFAHFIEVTEDAYQYTKPIRMFQQFIKNVSKTDPNIICLTVCNSKREYEMKKNKVKTDYPEIQEVEFVSSAEMKPDAIIDIASRYDVLTSNCFFFDDDMKTVARARDYGIHSWTPINLMWIINDLISNPEDANALMFKQFIGREESYFKPITYLEHPDLNWMASENGLITKVKNIKEVE